MWSFENLYWKKRCASVSKQVHLITIFLSVKQDVVLHLKRLESPSSEGVSAKFVEIVTDLGYEDISVVDIF